MDARILGPVTLAAFAEGDEQGAVPGDDDARAEMPAAARFRHHAEDDFHAGEGIAVEPGARHGGPCAAAAGLRE